MKTIERPPVRGRIRAYDLPPDLSPESDAEFRRWWPKLRGKAHLVHDRPNLVTTAGMNTLAAILGQAPLKNNLSNAYGSGAIYQQALGTGNAVPALTDTGLGNEIFRKAFTNVQVSGTLLVTSTYFSPTDLASAQSAVAASPTPTTSTFGVNVITGFRVGDLLQIALPTGYEYHTIASIAGSTITLASGDYLSAAPAVGATVNQCIAEAGMLGDESVNATALAGTAAFTSGSAIVTGTGTAWTKAWAGDQIKLLPNASNAWHTIASVQSATQLTLSANASATASGSFAFRGTLYNHVNALAYVKLSSRGFVFENDWTMGG